MADELGHEAASTAASRPRRTTPSTWRRAGVAVAVLASTFSPASAQSCVSLRGSSQCPAFNESSVSTSVSNILYVSAAALGPARLWSSLTFSSPFMAFVSSTQDFDTRLSEYVNTTYVQSKYQNLLGCPNVNLTNTPPYYARYTTSVICNAIVQNSVQPCRLSGRAAVPLCADSCAQSAISEEEITMTPDLCRTPGPNVIPQIRADFTNCALPADSLSGGCLPASANEPTECGFGGNRAGLCRYCGASSPNATDSCCRAARVEQRCQGVVLPSLAGMPTLFPSSTAPATPTGSSTAPPAAGAAAAGNASLSGGAIAGIVIGSLVGAALLLGLLIAACVLVRRRRERAGAGNAAFAFNQPSPRRSPPMATVGLAGAAGAGAGVGAGAGAAAAARQSREAPRPAPGGRVARMAALEANTSSSDDKNQRQRGPGFLGSDSESGAAGAAGRTRRRDAGSRSSSSYFAAGGGAAGAAGLSGPEDSSSPANNAQLSSPEGGLGTTSAQSEQLSAFRDYYSPGDIHPGELVATLWAYQPRAGDEFELERGDMLRVAGIWDDGWATGVRVAERAEDWEAAAAADARRAQRDSGVSNGSGARAEGGGAGGEEGATRAMGTPVGEVKAFPLVCVCLPEHWRKTIEGDTSTETGSQSGAGPRPPGGGDGAFRDF